MDMRYKGSLEIKILVGLVLSQLMGGIRGIAIPLLVYGGTQSLTDAAMVTLSGLLPALVVGIVGAPFIDRMNRKKFIVVANLIRVVLLVVVPLAWGLYGVAYLLVLAFVTACLGALEQPALQASLPSLFGEKSGIRWSSSWVVVCCRGCFADYRRCARRIDRCGTNLGWMRSGVLALFRRDGTRSAVERTCENKHVFLEGPAGCVALDEGQHCRTDVIHLLVVFTGCCAIGCDDSCSVHHVQSRERVICLWPRIRLLWCGIRGVIGHRWKDEISWWGTVVVGWHGTGVRVREHGHARQSWVSAVLSPLGAVGCRVWPRRGGDSNSVRENCSTKYARPIVFIDECHDDVRILYWLFCCRFLIGSPWPDCDDGDCWPGVHRRNTLRIRFQQRCTSYRRSETCRMRVPRPFESSVSATQL